MVSGLIIRDALKVQPKLWFGQIVAIFASFGSAEAVTESAESKIKNFD